jgi:hypothetical protein
MAFATSTNAKFVVWTFSSSYFRRNLDAAC